MDAEGEHFLESYAVPNKTSPLLAAIDCGTSSVKAAVFDSSGYRVALSEQHVPCVHESDGSVHQDPLAVRNAAFRCLQRAMRAVRSAPRRTVAVCVTNQRATLLCLDSDGRPAAPAYAWQDMRGSAEVAAMGRSLGVRAYRRLTGLPPHPVFSLGKLLWIRRREKELFRRSRRFSLFQDYLARELGAEDFFCDLSNASLTGLLDIRSLSWSEALLGEVGVRPERLPSLVPSGRRIGAVSRRASAACGLLPGTPIVSGGGDQQCAGLGSGCVEPGVTSITLGTAGVCFSAARRPVFDLKGGIQCCVHAMPGRWNVEGLQHSAGDSLRWANDAIGKAGGASEPGARGLLFYPFLCGSGAPDWRESDTGLFAGLRRAHKNADLVQAVLEGVAMENRRIVERFSALGVPVSDLRLAGGGVRLAEWGRIHADLFGRPVRAARDPHATLLGAAMIAALGAGVVQDMAEAASRMVRAGETVEPDRRRSALYQRFYRRYREGLASLREANFFERLAAPQGRTR